MSLVASKARVAPLKKMTLPRLELMGAVIGARLANNLIISLKMEQAQIKMWTDSMITLQWICSSAQRWKPFVANRVTEIQTLTSPSSWSHIPGKANPADLATRGQSVDYKTSYGGMAPVFLYQKIGYVSLKMKTFQTK